MKRKKSDPKKLRTCFAPGRRWASGQPNTMLTHAVINPRWCTRRTSWYTWTLTHRGTGLDATDRLMVRQDAYRLAKELDERFGAKAWKFTDPRDVPSGAKEYVRRFRIVL